MSSFIVMLAEGDGTRADGWSAISVVLFLMLVVACCLKGWVWDSCAWRLRRLGRPERPWHHSFGMNIATPEEDKNGWDIYKCDRCGYVLRRDRTV